MEGQTGYRQVRWVRLCPPGHGGQRRAVWDSWSGGFGLDSVGDGKWWQGLESGSVKGWQKYAGWIVGQRQVHNNAVEQEGSADRTHAPCGSHRHRQQERVAGDMGRRHEGVTHCLGELKGRQESEGTPTFQSE